MKVLLIVVVALVVIVGLIAIVILVVGSRLPVAHTASRSIRLKQQPADVYAVVRDFAGSPKWRSDLKGVEVTIAEDGKTQFRENGANGVINYQLDEDAPNVRLVTRILDRDLGYSGSWAYEFSSVADGTLVTITENGKVSNIFFRFMSRYVFGHAATIDSYLNALAGRFGESVRPGDAGH